MPEGTFPELEFPLRRRENPQSPLNWRVERMRLSKWWVDGEINRAFQKEAQIMKERSQNVSSTPHPGPLPGRGGEGGRKVLALIPRDLDGFLFSADYQSGKKAEITSRVAANFVGWEKDHELFDRELEKVILALRTDEGGREKPPPARL